MVYNDMIQDAIFNARKDEIWKCIEILEKDYRELKGMNHEMAKGIHLAILKLKSRKELVE